MDTGLRYFAEAITCRSMRLAADRLGVAVSSISRQVAQLERDFGFPLIERNSRAITVTEAGRLVLDFHRARLAARDTLYEGLEALRGLSSGSVEISIGEGFVNLGFVELIEGFRVAHKGLEIVVSLEMTRETVRRVIEDEVHMGLVLHAPAEPRVSMRASIAQPLMVVCRPGHPITKHARITLRELSNHAVALPPKHTRIRQLLAAAEIKRGVWLKASVVTDSLYMLRELTKAGDIVTILPTVSVMSEVEQGTLVCLPLAEPEVETAKMYIITRLGRELGPGPSRFLPQLEAKLKSLAAGVKPRA